MRYSWVNIASSICVVIYQLCGVGKESPRLITGTGHASSYQIDYNKNGYHAYCDNSKDAQKNLNDCLFFQADHGERDNDAGKEEEREPVAIPTGYIAG